MFLCWLGVEFLGVRLVVVRGLDKFFRLPGGARRRVTSFVWPKEVTKKRPAGYVAPSGFTALLRKLRHAIRTRLF